MSIRKIMYQKYGIYVTRLVSEPQNEINEQWHAMIQYELNDESIKLMKNADALYVLSNEYNIPLQNNKIRCIILNMDKDGNDKQAPVESTMKRYFDKYTG